MVKSMGFSEADLLLEQWVRTGLIPGAVLDIRADGHSRFTKAYGSYSDGEQRHPIRTNTLFDVASLTKVCCTLPAILLLAAEGKLRLDESVSAYLPPFRHRKVTIRHLLMHTSGLPPDLPYVRRADSRNDVVEQIMQQELRSAPGERVSYSDLGYILLGRIAELVAGEPFDRFVSNRIHLPLGMTDARFVPGEDDILRCAATELVDGRYVRGQVHDEKAWHMGGVCGSAGLFATADDLAAYAQAWLFPDRQSVLPANLLRESLQDPLQGRGLGWEVIHDGAPRPISSGKLWPSGSFGHTGFTGTSLWIDPVHRITVVFLTNAVHYGRNHRLKELRPVLHDAVLASCQ
jgi:CubicO group peptidase (beta-lactamase class C family)